MALKILCHTIFILTVTFAAVVDIRERKIPNIISLCGLVPFIIKVVLFFSEYNCENYNSENDDFISFFIEMAGGLLLVLLFIGLPYLINKSIGGGDLKLAAVSGLFIGSKGTLTVLCVAFVTCAFCGASVLIYNKLKKTAKPHTLPFAPFLLLGILYFYLNYYIN